MKKNRPSIYCVQQIRLFRLDKRVIPVERNLLSSSYIYIYIYTCLCRGSYRYIIVFIYCCCCIHNTYTYLCMYCFAGVLKSNYKVWITEEWKRFCHVYNIYIYIITNPWLAWANGRLVELYRKLPLYDIYY